MQTRRGPFGHPLPPVEPTPPADVQAAVASARAAQRAWADRPVAERAAVLLRLHDLVIARRSEILDLVQHEAGKSRVDAFEEVADVASVARHYARRTARYLRPRRYRGLVPGMIGARVYRDPHGVVGVIAPWNFPLVLTLGELLPALMAGNAVVVKPDPLTAQTCRLGLELLAQAGVPRGLVQQVDGGVAVGQALIAEVDHVIFTGSTVAGRAVAAQAAERLIGSTLELGGKNSMYVRADADLRLAVPGAARNAFANAGQLCLAAERVIVHRDVADEFVDAFVGRVASITLGNTLDFGYLMGSQISAVQVDKVRNHIDDAVARGATLLTGGRLATDVGPFVVQPTVLGDVPTSAHCYREETFGPVVSVFVVSNDDEALHVAADTGGALTASVWTRDARAGLALARRMSTGSVSINEHYAAVWGSTAVPFGGVGESGSGRRHGPDAVTGVTRAQTIVTQRAAPLGLALSGLHDLPGQTWTSLYTTGLRLLRGVGAS